MASASSIRILDLREPPSSNRPTTVYNKKRAASSARELAAAAAAPIFYVKEQRRFVFDVANNDDDNDIFEDPPTVIVQPDPNPNPDSDPDRTPNRPIDSLDPRVRSVARASAQRLPPNLGGHALTVMPAMPSMLAMPTPPIQPLGRSRGERARTKTALVHARPRSSRRVLLCVSLAIGFVLGVAIAALVAHAPALLHAVHLIR